MKFKNRITQLCILIKYYLTVIFIALFNKKTKNIWLISERGDEARDNGYSFFIYLKKEHPEINTKFVISKKSPDIDKLSDYKNDIIYYRTLKHCYYFVLSEVLISTHIMGFSPDFRSIGKLIRKKLIYFRGKQVFLQHGITKDDAPGLYMEKTHLDLFICGAKKEFEYINKTFHYEENEVQYTGFARYDYLINKLNNTILLMPTWRENLYGLTDEEFKMSNYYTTYQNLINSKKIDKILKDNNYKLIFYPHYEIQKKIKLFSTNCKNIIIANFKDYSVPELLKSTSLLITDFSSVYFDVAYLRKPVIYYQFDYESYRKNHYKEGYFSYENDGFGPIAREQEELIKKIENNFENKFAIEEKYEKRIDSFFVYKDKNNCNRIYNQIVRILKKDGD